MDQLSNYQFSSQSPKGGFLEGIKKIDRSAGLLLLLFFMASSFLLPSTGFSQGQIIGTVPIVIDPLNPPGCPQNNVNIAEIQFRQLDGTPFPGPFNPVGLDLGDNVPGKIFIKFGGSTTNAYNLYAQFDVYINGVKTGATRTLCLFPGVNVPTQDGLFYFIDNFNWNYGEKIEINNIYMTWTTGNAGDGNCTPRLQNAQCYYNPTGLVVNTPLVANFDFTTNCDDFTVDFEDLTTGGNPADYAYSWSFTGGTPASSVASDPQNVDFGSANSYEVTLQVTSEGIVKSIQKTVTLYGISPAAPVLTVPTPLCDATTVTITFTAVDGVEYSLNSDFSTTIAEGSFTAGVSSSGTVYARTEGTTCVSSSAFEVAPAPVTPTAPELTVPAPTCDATTVTITFT
uniref:hypothetical protein n=1 Tax=Algoriphagus aquimarinus TaxID=237018 RepID=UPI0030D92378